MDQEYSLEEQIMKLERNDIFYRQFPPVKVNFKSNMTFQNIANLDVSYQPPFIILSNKGFQQKTLRFLLQFRYLDGPIIDQNELFSFYKEIFINYSKSNFAKMSFYLRGNTYYLTKFSEEIIIFMDGFDNALVLIGLYGYQRVGVSHQLPLLTLGIITQFSKNRNIYLKTLWSANNGKNNFLKAIQQQK